MARDNREDRRKIMSHFHHFHGQPRLNSVENRFFLADLKAMHREMHQDGYFCPPHFHNSDDVNNEEIDLLLGETYLEDLRHRHANRVLGDDGEPEEFEKGIEELIREEEKKGKKKRKKKKKNKT